MPIFDYLCEECGKSNELLVFSSDNNLTCQFCGSSKLKKQISAHSSLSGNKQSKLPGLGDTTCCGSSPNEAGCAGPGSCCGRM